MLSVLIPIKDEAENLFPLYISLKESLEPLLSTHEIVFVDDGSRDASFSILTEIAEKDPGVKVVRLRRNFGQTAALQAAITHSRGDVLVTMDGDLQNDPRDIPLLLAKLEDGFDVVLGERVDRQDDFILRKIPSWIANAMIRRVTSVPFRDFGCTMRAMRRTVAESLPLYGEMHRFVPALAQQGGARIAQIPVRHHARRAGVTKYGISRTIRVFLDLITVQFLNRFVTRPMHLFGAIGLATMLAGFLSLLTTIVMKYGGGVDMTGNPLLLLSAMLSLCGMQFVCTGLLGELLARTYFESQGKAAYLVGETLNVDRPARTKRRRRRKLPR